MSELTIKATKSKTSGKTPIKTQRKRIKNRLSKSKKKKLWELYDNEVVACDPDKDKALDIGSVSGSLFGFEIGGRLIELKAKSEKHALMQLVKNYWELIDKSGNIELLGGRK